MTRRVYTSPAQPVIYPGEVAQAEVDLPTLVALAERLARSENSGHIDLPIVRWVVEPAPGWRAYWLRWRYRLWGRWFSRGVPSLEIKADVKGPS